MDSATATLDRVPEGSTAHVIRIDGEDLLARRLADMGLWPGTAVEVQRVGPFGDPVQYALRGFRLALRRSEAARVVVGVASRRPGVP
jgi:Fe2+ transport system protein FeoA